MPAESVRDPHLIHSVRLRNAGVISLQDSKSFADYVRNYCPEFSKQLFAALLKHTPINKVKREMLIQPALFEEYPLFNQLLMTHARVFVNLLYFRMVKKAISPKQYRIFFSQPSPLPAVSINRLSLLDDQKLLRVKGIIKTCTNTFPVLRRGVYICANCKHHTSVINSYFARTVPNCVNRCKYSEMLLDEQKSLYVDVRKIELQEIQENLLPGEQPRLLCGFIESLSSLTLIPGKEHTVTGLLLKYLPDKTPFSIQYLDIFQTERDNKAQKRHFTRQEIASFQEYALNNKGKLVDVVGQAIFRDLLIDRFVKHALILQMCGGILSEQGVRSDIHVLLVGDPGSGKSEMLKTISRFTGGIFASGVTSSGPGLTAAVVKDSIIPGRWGVEVGAFVFADRGLIALDQIDKVKGGDLATLHEAMEQQTISIAKAGILMTLNSRCSVLAAANPQFGHFVDTVPLEKQLTVPPTILNRFDIVFFMKDRHSLQYDQQLVKTILTKKSSGDGQWPFLRRYIQYVKTLKPAFTKVAQDRVREFYAKLRSTSKLAVTARQLHAIVRLAQAAAKLRCASYVIGKDVDAISQVITNSLESHTQLHTLKQLGMSNKKSALLMQLYKQICRRKSVTHAQLLEQYESHALQQAIAILLSRTMIYEPHHQIYEPV